MKKNMEVWMSMLLILIVLVCASNIKRLVATARTENTVIVIDAGHGGVDPGKVGVNNVLEKDINLSIAQMVKKNLEENNITVVMTRDSDAGLYSEGDTNKKVTDMKARCQIINDSECLFAVSIHQNSYSEESVSGPQVFYYEGSIKGEVLARVLQTELIDALNPKKVRQEKSNDSYYLLKNATCPVVIVECGFLSNWEEATLLCDSAYQEKVAKAISDGILSYIDNYP